MFTASQFMYKNGTPLQNGKIAEPYKLLLPKTSVFPVVLFLKRVFAKQKFNSSPIIKFESLNYCLMKSDIFLRLNEVVNRILFMREQIIGLKNSFEF